MARRSSFLLRTDPRILDALRRWADDELRSMNGQVEYLLRKALRDSGRLKAPDEPSTETDNSDSQEEKESDTH